MACRVNLSKNIFISFRPYISRESLLSISSADFSSAYDSSFKLSENLGNEPLVISSEIWENEENMPLLEEMALNPHQIRVQISLGVEFKKYEQRLRDFLKMGGSCDLLFDRPITPDFQRQLQELTTVSDIRLCLVVSRYFDPLVTIHALSTELRKKLYVVFFPPESKDSCYLSSDEVIRVLNSLDGANVDWNALAFPNLVQRSLNEKDRFFFLTLDGNSYYDRPHLLKEYRLFRTTIVWMARRKFVFILDFLYSVIIFLKDPRNFIRYRTWTSLRHGVHMLAVVIWHRVLKPTPPLVRHKFRHFIVITINFVRYRTWATTRHYIQMMFIVLWHRILKPLPDRMKYNVILPLRDRLSIFIHYKLLPWASLIFRYRIPAALRIIFYPAYKVFWFLSYQVETRILSQFKRESKD